MIFNLSSYSDLGKCSLGTMLTEWDTDKFHIYVNNEEVKINRVQDLFPYLWRNAGITSSNQNRRDYFFSSSTESYWWDRYEEESKERMIAYARSFIRKHGRNEDLTKSYFKWMAPDVYAYFKKIFNVVKEHPYKKKQVIPSEIKSRLYISYMELLKKCKAKIIADNS